MFVELIRRLRPIGRLPLLVRYLITALIVLACLGLRFWLDTFEESRNLPLFLVFMPAVLLASFLFDRGAGFFAVFLSAVLGSYFFVEPRTSFALPHVGEIVRLVAFIAIGMLTAAIVEALRTTVSELASTNDALSAAQSEAKSGLSLLNAILEGTPDPIFIKDREGRFVQVNAATARLMRAPGQNLIGRRIRDFLPEVEAHAIETVDEEVMASRRPRVVEEVVTSSEGVPRTYLTTKAPWLGPDGDVIGLICVTHDIHHRKLTEQRVRLADAQKQVLLEDINHRIKNHLQSLAALMFRSKQGITDEKARSALNTAIGHLHVLARVYDRLQLDRDATGVDAREFIEDLCTDLNATVANRPTISLRTRIEPVILSSARAVLVGLAVNELVTNALKYAFPGDREGEIVVSLHRKDGAATLEVRDDGVGMQAEESRGRGKRLVGSLARELGGSVEWLDNGGTTVVLSFPAEVTQTEQAHATSASMTPGNRIGRS